MALVPTNLTTKDELCSGVTTTTSSVSWSAGDLIVVRVGAWQYPGSFAATGVSIGGNAATKQVAWENLGTSQADRNHAGVWTWAPGSGGSGTVVVTFGGTNLAASVVVDQITGHHASPIGNNDTDIAINGAGVDPSLTVSTTAGSLVLAVGAIEDASGNMTDAGGQTSDFRGTQDGSCCRYFASKTAAGTSTTISWTEAVNDRAFGAVALEILAAAGGASIVPMLTTRRIQAA